MSAAKQGSVRSYEVTVVIDPSDKSRTSLKNKPHLVMYRGEIIQHCWDLAEARVWASGFEAGLATTPSTGSGFADFLLGNNA